MHPSGQAMGERVTAPNTMSGNISAGESLTLEMQGTGQGTIVCLYLANRQVALSFARSMDKLNRIEEKHAPRRTYLPYHQL